MKPQLIIFGGGGHCKSCMDVIEQEGKFHIAGIVDVPDKLNQKILDYKVIATDADIPNLVKEYEYFFIAFGHIKSPAKRIKYFKLLKSLKVKLPVIISPHAYVSRHATIGEGTIVMHHAIINTDARIGRNCIINNKGLVEHDVQIGDHCHVAPAAVLNGGVKVDSETFLGSNSVAREFITIGRNVIIGCNAKVVKDTPSGSFIT